MARALLAVASALLLVACATGPELLLRRHAYDGPRRPAGDLATVFAKWHGAGGEQTYICGVDGRSYRERGPESPCPSVVFVPPGPHAFEVVHRLGFRSGSNLLTFAVRAGRAYEVRSTVHDTKYTRYSWHAMPPGYALTYGDLAPGLAAKGDRPDRPVTPDDPD